MPSKPIFLFALLPLLLAACSREQPAASAPPPPAVTAVTVASAPVTLTRELPGRSAPFLVAEVRPQVTGIVQKRLFDEGERVEEGQPLYQLDDSTYRADFLRAKATLERARATAELARVNARRAANLAELDAVSRQENETAIATLAQAEADVGVAEAALQSAEVQLGYATIRSPIAGRIGRSTVTQGALVTANQEAALATVQALDPIYVDVTQSSRELLELRRDFAAGTLRRPEEIPVTIMLEDGSKYQHEGRLEFAEVSVDPTTGRFALRVVVPNPDQILLPGMFLRAIISTGVRENAILVPQQGIARDPRGTTSAMVVGENNTVEVRQVKVSRTVGDQWLVESGLQPGDRLIVEGLQKIAPGAQVQITATEIKRTGGPTGGREPAPAAPALPGEKQ
jgi:membrane fusion protein (multidrug efflux system)